LALDVYFRDDILNVIRATYAAADGPSALLSELVRDPELRQMPLDRLVEAYRQGFCTALGAVALAFGLDPSDRRANPPAGLSAVVGQDALPRGRDAARRAVPAIPE
jgi:hypothetical protein